MSGCLLQHLLPWDVLDVTIKAPASTAFTKSVKLVNQAKELGKHDGVLAVWPAALALFIESIIHLRLMLDLSTQELMWICDGSRCMYITRMGRAGHPDAFT